MTPDAAPSPHSLATASGLLLGALAAAMALGALVGWAVGDAGFGPPRRRDRRDPARSRRRLPGLRPEARTHERRDVLDAAAAAEPARARRSPAATIIALALPIFAVAGWPLEAWALAAVLWVASEIFAAVLARLPDSPDNLAAAGMRGIGTTSRALLVGIVLVIVTVSNETVGLAAAILYAIAFTVELGVGLATYFGGEAKA